MGVVCDETEDFVGRGLGISVWVEVVLARGGVVWKAMVCVGLAGGVCVDLVCVIGGSV